MQNADVGEGDAGGTVAAAPGAAVRVAVRAGADDERPERLVFGIDFSSASLGAARWTAARLRARRRGGPDAIDACLVHVVPWPDGAAALDVAVDGDRPLRRLRPALLGGLAGFAASLRLDGARPLVQVGSPSARLAEVAAAEGARLVVLGRRRDSARQRIGEPDVIQRVARRAACDVLIVPEGTPEPIAHVIAAVDASAAAAPVVARALAVARAHDAALTLVHVLSPTHGSYDRLVRRRPRPSDDAARPHVAGEAAYRDAAYAWLAWLARDAAPPVGCQLAVPNGDAGREILDLAARHGPTVVVLGKRGADETPVGALGSVARELVARCPSPVLVVDCAGAALAREG